MKKQTPEVDAVVKQFKDGHRTVEKARAALEHYGAKDIDALLGIEKPDKKD